MKIYKSLGLAHAFLCGLLVVLSPFSLVGPTSAQSKKVTAADEVAHLVNLADFGAVGDGVADDGPALQNALNALADAGGGTLFVPAGHYLVATPVVKDFSELAGASVTIRGVPSDTMPAPPTATGDQLSQRLDLTSEIIPATGSVDSVFTLSNLHDLTVEHLGFIGRESETSDAYVTLNLIDIATATVRHCEFYGISTFGLVAGQGGGNVIRAVHSDLAIQQSSVLGSTANSGAYAAIVDNRDWKGFSISNSIFIDYGQGPFYGKMGLGSPLSWINFGGPAARTPESPRRQVVIRDTFLDEGGWIGITAFPQLWNATEKMDLLYISGLKMNVSNFGTAGNQFYDVKNVLIENSYYGWSHITGAAVDFYRSEHAILDQLTCVEAADKIRADARTDRLTVVNSEFESVESLAQTTTVLETSPEDDPVQYVSQRFLATLGRQPDPASHFFWSDLLVRCGNDQNCRDSTRTELTQYLNMQPEPEFSLAGKVTDEAGNPVSGATLSLTGSQLVSSVSDTDGNFQFSGLPTSGVYTVKASKPHYTFLNDTQTITHPARDVNVSFNARLNRHSISGRIVKLDGTGAGGVQVKLLQSGSVVSTNANGEYNFVGLAEGDTYTILPSSEDFVFLPGQTIIVDLSADSSANFTIRPMIDLIKIENSQEALALDSVIFVREPFSVLDSLRFGSDGNRRAMFFARNLDGLNDRSQFSMFAEDSDGQTYPLEIEFIGEVPQQSWLRQLNVKLSAELGGKCVEVKLSVGEMTSKPAHLCVTK